MPRGKHKLFKEQNTFKTDMNYISLDLKAHWQHDASIIRRTACEWLRREKSEWTTCLRGHPSVVVGSRSGTGAPMRGVFFSFVFFFLQKHFIHFIFLPFCQQLIIEYCKKRKQFLLDLNPLLKHTDT